MLIVCIAGTFTLFVLAITEPNPIASAIFTTGSIVTALLGAGHYLLIEQNEEKKTPKDKDDE